MVVGAHYSGKTLQGTCRYGGCLIFMPKKELAGGSVFLTPAKYKRRPTTNGNHVETYHVRNKTKNNEKRRLKKWAILLHL